MLNLIINYLWDLFRPKHDLLLENIALRQQILVLERQVKRPKFRDRERAFWVVLSRHWSGWKSPLRLVQPQTVVSWHRRSWRLFWKWKSKPKDHGRPTVPLEVWAISSSAEGASSPIISANCSAMVCTSVALTLPSPSASIVLKASSSLVHCKS